MWCVVNAHASRWVALEYLCNNLCSFLSSSFLSEGLPSPWLGPSLCKEPSGTNIGDTLGQGQTAHWAWIWRGATSLTLWSLCWPAIMPSSWQWAKCNISTLSRGQCVTADPLSRSLEVCLCWGDLFTTEQGEIRFHQVYKIIAFVKYCKS